MGIQASLWGSNLVCPTSAWFVCGVHGGRCGRLPSRHACCTCAPGFGEFHGFFGGVWCHSGCAPLSPTSAHNAGRLRFHFNLNSLHLLGGFRHKAQRQRIKVARDLCSQWQKLITKLRDFHGFSSSGKTSFINGFVKKRLHVETPARPATTCPTGQLNKRW